MNAPNEKAVPREPTPEMLDAAANTPGIKAIDSAASIHQLRGYPLPTEAFAEGSPLQQAWRAMWDAFPASPVPSDQARADYAPSGWAQASSMRLEPSTSVVVSGFTDQARLDYLADLHDFKVSAKYSEPDGPVLFRLIAKNSCVGAGPSLRAAIDAAMNPQEPKNG